MKWQRFILFLPFLLFFVILGCSDSLSPASGGVAGNGLGATPGGAQDMDYVRLLINNGTIPDPASFHVEGIFSEYDLPIDGDPPDKTLTVRSAHGYASDARLPGSGVNVQIGLASNIDPATFHRSPLNLSVVVDRSGSMSGSKIAAVIDALTRLIDKLDEDDIISIVLFNQNMDILIPPTSVSDKDYLKGQVSEITAGGSTNMDIGLRQGYRYVRDNLDHENHSDRVMLLTDALPNTGDYSPGNFRDLVAQGADDGIGITAFGVGIDFDQELMDLFATLEGANYFFLHSEEKIRTVFDEDLDLIVTPVAYNLEVDVSPAAGFTCSNAYGFPGDEAEFEVKTVFLSRNRGALLLGFEPQFPDREPIITRGAPLADVSLSYFDAEGNAQSEQLNIVYSGEDIDDPDVHYFEQDGVRLTVALMREVTTMKLACELYYEDQALEGAELLGFLETYLETENAALGDNILASEIELTQRLERLMVMLD